MRIAKSEKWISFFEQYGEKKAKGYDLLFFQSDRVEDVKGSFPKNVPNYFRLNFTYSEVPNIACYIFPS